MDFSRVSFPSVGGARRWGALAGLIGLALVAGCRAPQPPPPPPPPSVTVATGRASARSTSTTSSAAAWRRSTVEIRPRVSVYIQRVAFSKGSEVRKGRRAVRDRSPPLPGRARPRGRPSWPSPQRRRRWPPGTLERVPAPGSIAGHLARGVRPHRQHRRRGGGREVRAAEAAVATARLDLEWTHVRAPIDGRVGRAEVTEGNLVQAGPPDRARA